MGSVALIESYVTQARDAADGECIFGTHAMSRLGVVPDIDASANGVRPALIGAHPHTCRRRRWFLRDGSRGRLDTTFRPMGISFIPPLSADRRYCVGESVADISCFKRVTRIIATTFCTPRSWRGIFRISRRARGFLPDWTGC